MTTSRQPGDGAHVASRFSVGRVNHRLSCERARPARDGAILKPLRLLPEAAEEVSTAPRAAATDAEVAGEVRRGVRLRCEAELAKPVTRWEQISIQTVVDGHTRREKGMFYGIEFPWTEEMLVAWGPGWLTNAFRKAGTLGEDNWVTEVIPESAHKITIGNNGGKFFFKVRYWRHLRGLHTSLFAKIPFPLDGHTRSDRLSSSVNKQPQEFYEINAYRLLEASLPVRMPKFYFGDISNSSTNWILITERVSFSDSEGVNFDRPQGRREPLAPFQVEGPYDKCLDHSLRGDPREYYVLLVRTGAKIAGLHKAGKLGPEVSLRANFQDMLGLPKQAYGMAPSAVSGEPPSQVQAKLDMFADFSTKVAAALFPSYVSEDAFQRRLADMLLTLNAYSREIMYWKHSLSDYVALTHPNMQVDNSYFWRTADGALDLGVFDWGNLGAFCLGHRLWWWLYCSDYEVLSGNLDLFVDVLASVYFEHGGPKLDRPRLRMMFLLTALEHMLLLIAAVPQIYRMCPRQQWAEIRDRYDKRISENVDGKSTLRLYLHVMVSICRLVEELDCEQLVDRWIAEHWTCELGMPPKRREVIVGPATS